MDAVRNNDQHLPPPSFRMIFPSKRTGPEPGLSFDVFTRSIFNPMYLFNSNYLCPCKHGYCHNAASAGELVHNLMLMDCVCLATTQVEVTHQEIAVAANKL